MARLKRAYSVDEVLNMNIPSYDFTGQWKAAIGNPARSGTWIVWGESGNGKSSFVMQLVKYLCGFGKVIYDSLEEGTSLSFQKSLQRHGMLEARRRLTILDREPIDQLRERLDRRKSAAIVVIDSLQYSGLNFRSYQRLKESYPGKLFIFISHADGDRPKGAFAERVEYDSDVKIMVSCFKASCKSRFREGVEWETITVWKEGAVKVLLDDGQNEKPAEEPAV